MNWTIPDGKAWTGTDTWVKSKMQHPPHRIFIHYEGLSPPKWIHEYLETNVSEKGDAWWSQCVTDTWDTNTNCYYFECEQAAKKFHMLYKLRGEQ